MRRSFGRWCGLVAAGLLIAAVGQAQKKADVVLGSEYTCNGGQTRFVVKACKQVYTFEQCDVQYLNAAAPNGLGALTQMRKEMLESSLSGCTVAGAAVATKAVAEGTPGQAQYLGTWYDVKVLERRAGKVRVRWSTGTEDWMDEKKVRGAGAAAAKADEAAPDALADGRYACTGRMGSQLVTFGFVDIKGKTYRGPSHAPSGAYAPFTMGDDGEIVWSKGFGEFHRDNGVTYESAKAVAGDKPRFRVKYRTASGRAEALDCGRE